jgi:hypothetical protein
MKVPLTTRLDPPLRQRLRVYVAVTGRKVEDVVSAALTGYLPSMSEMVQNGGDRARSCSRNSQERRDEPHLRKREQRRCGHTDAAQ